IEPGDETVDHADQHLAENQTDIGRPRRRGARIDDVPQHRQDGHGDRDRQDQANIRRYPGASEARQDHDAAAYPAEGQKQRENGPFRVGYHATIPFGALSSGDGAQNLDLEPLGQFHMREDGERSEQPLDDHAHIGAGFRRGYKDEGQASVHVFTDYFRRLLAELLEAARIDVEFDHFALAVPLQGLMEDHVPFAAESQHTQHAIVGQVAAKLL